MAKIKIIRNHAIIESEYTREDLETLAKYAPDALVLKDEEGNEKFAAYLSTNDAGSICRAGVCYGAQADKTKTAAATLDIPVTVGDAEAWVMEHVGTALLKMQELEKQFGPALEKIKSDLASVKQSITVVAE